MNLYSNTYISNILFYKYILVKIKVWNGLGDSNIRQKAETNCLRNTDYIEKY